MRKQIKELIEIEIILFCFENKQHISFSEDEQLKVHLYFMYPYELHI